MTRLCGIAANLHLCLLAKSRYAFVAAPCGINKVFVSENSQCLRRLFTRRIVFIVCYNDSILHLLVMVKCRVLHVRYFLI